MRERRSISMVIVYTSNTGFTKEYAQMLSKAEKMKCYELAQAEEQLGQDAEVLYMGPLMAGRIEGLEQARKKFALRAACGVGMSPHGQQVLTTLSKANYVENAPIFYLQGGWAPKKVSWLKRRMVNMVTRSVRKTLESKGSARTEEEQRYLDMLLKGGSFVAYQNLNTIRNWLKEQA